MEIKTIQQALAFMASEFDMHPIAQPGSEKWYQLSNNKIGCELKTSDEGNVTFVFNVTYAYGHFQYTEMHISFINKAGGKLAYRRTMIIRRATRGINQ